MNDRVVRAGALRSRHYSRPILSLGITVFGQEKARSRGPGRGGGYSHSFNGDEAVLSWLEAPAREEGSSTSSPFREQCGHRPLCCWLVLVDPWAPHREALCFGCISRATDLRLGSCFPRRLLFLLCLWFSRWSIL